MTMRHHPAPHSDSFRLVRLIACVAVMGGASARVNGQTANAREYLERPGGIKIDGQLVAQGPLGPGFLPRGAKDAKPQPLEPGMLVSFEGPAPAATVIPPLFQVLVGENARL